MPKLKIVSGEQEKHEVPVWSDMTIGRLSQCDLILGEPGVSRQHARIEERDGRWTIRDLGSQNGTFVNGREIQAEEPLREGDQIQIAEFDMVFTSEGGEAPTVGTGMRTVAAPDGKTIQLRAAIRWEEETFSCAIQACGDLAKAVRAVDAIERASQALHQARSQDELFTCLAQALMNTYPDCTCCHVLTWDPRGEEFSSMASQSRIGDGEAGFSSTAASLTVQQQEALLCTDIESHSEFLSSESVHALGIKSFVCSPIQRGGQVRGVIYLDSRESQAAFSEDDLRVLCVIGQETALAWENVARYDGVRTERDDLRAQNVDLRMELSAGLSTAAIVGSSPPFQVALEDIERFAAFPSIPVLITGETGTGKELFARAVHERSPRRSRPYMVINCPTLPRDLLESELFGHEPGAFTGATKRRIGKIELADGGTVFLDEVTEMTTDAQAKLLRMLESGEFNRLGSSQLRRADVRIVAATNRGLEDEIRASRFRPDLYHRLAGVQVHLPPLRDRGKDVLLLAQHFLGQFASENRLQVSCLSASAQAALLAYGWPGNVRELKQAVQSAAVRAHTKGTIDEEDLPPAISAGIRSSRDASGTLHEAVAAFEEDAIVAALERERGNIVRTAQVLGLSRQGLRNKIEKYGIDDVLRRLREGEAGGGRE